MSVIQTLLLLPSITFDLCLPLLDSIFVLPHRSSIANYLRKEKAGAAFTSIWYINTKKVVYGKRICSSAIEIFDKISSFFSIRLDCLFVLCVYVFSLRTKKKDVEENPNK